MSRRTLALVQRYQDTQRPNPQASYPSSYHNLIPLCIRRDLHNDPNTEYNAPGADGVLSAESIRKGRRDQSSYQSANRQESHNQSGPSICELGCGRSTRVLGVWEQLAEALEEIVHLEKTGDLTSIVSEDQTTHRDQDAHQDGAPCCERVRGVVELAVGRLAIVRSRGDRLSL